MNIELSLIELQLVEASLLATKMMSKIIEKQTDYKIHGLLEKIREQKKNYYPHSLSTKSYIENRVTA